MKRIVFGSGLIICAAFWGAQAIGEVGLTVYNNDLALVKDVRQLELKTGVNTLKFFDVAAAIDPTSIRAALLEAAQCGVSCLSNPLADETAEDSQSVFAVRVVDDETGDPVPGVALKITLPDGEEEVHTTDNDGMVEIDDMETPGTCDVTCEIDDGTNDETADFVRRE